MIDARDALIAHRASTVTEIKQRWGAQVCYLRDPENNRIELWQAELNNHGRNRLAGQHDLEGRADVCCAFYTDLAILRLNQSPSNR